MLEKDDKPDEEPGGAPRARVPKELERYYKSSFSSYILHRGKQAGLNKITKKSTYLYLFVVVFLS